MKHILLFAISLFTLTSFAQTLSENQVRKYLDALRKEEIISEYGKDGFLKALSKDNPAGRQRLSGIPMDALGNMPDSLFKSRGAILGFVGVFELMRNVGSAADELVQIREMAEKILGESMYFKPDVDGNINPKNPISFLGLEQNLKVSKEQYLILAEKLKRIGLVDERVHNELLKWLEKDRIKLIKDFGFFIYAAKQTWFYDNYESLKNQQFKIISTLQANKLLTPEKAEIVKNSYKPFELKSKVEILSMCTNVLIIPAEQGNFTREEIYENLYKQIASKLLPDFSYTDFSIKEIKKTTAELPMGTPLGLPFGLGFNKDKKSYRLQYYVKGLAYAQKADTDFAWLKNLNKFFQPDVNLDTNVINSYAVFFSPLTGIGTKDFQSINDYLTDNHSSKRLLVINNEMNPLLPIRDGRKALVLLDSTQNALFKKEWQDNTSTPLFPLKDKVDFSNKFSREKLKAILNEFRDNAIIPTDNEEATDKAIVDFRFESPNRNYVKRSLLLSFPSIIAKINFNPEKHAEKVEAFKTFINELARVSHGKFNPQKVTDNFETEIAKSNKKDRVLVMNYKLKDKKYEYKQDIPKADNEFSVADNIVKNEKSPDLDDISLNEYELVEMVNSSLEDAKIDGAFYRISSNFTSQSFNNLSHYIFLSTKQYDYLENNHSEVFNEPVEQNFYQSYESQIAAFRTGVFADALKRENMLTDEAYKTLDLKSTKEPSDILKASPQAVLIDLNELTSKNDTELYAYILGKINNKLLTNVEFKDINYKQLNPDTDTTGFPEQMVSLKINGKPYEQTLYVSLAKVVKTALDSLKDESSHYFPGIGENQFKVINDYLNDAGSSQRLVIVCDYRSPMLSFVMFDSTQATLVQETLPNNYVDFSMYSREFSRDSLNNTLFELGRIGLIEPMNETRREDFILKFRREPGSGRQLLEKLPHVVVTSNIWELKNFKDVYKSLIDSLKTISRGQFNPVKLDDNFQKMLKKGEYTDRLFKYSFNLNGKKYSETQLVKALPKPKNKESASEYDYFDFDTMKFIELVNKALAEQNSEFTFYELHNEEDELAGPEYIFLSGRQYRWIKARYPEIFENYEDTRMFDSDKIEDKNKN